jgi:hypothetical protein
VIDGAAPTIRDVVIVSNTASLAGGGICVGNFYGPGSVTLIDALVIGNTAGYGGGLYQGSAVGAPRVVNTLFSRNRATYIGDAIYQARGSGDYLQTTVVDPTASARWGMYVESGTVGITNTVIVGYVAGVTVLAGSTFEEHNLFYQVGIPISGTVKSGGGDVVGGNPRFLNPSTDDYHLGAGSAAIDAGTNDGVMDDIDGEPRPLGRGYDIGYDEATIVQDRYRLNVSTIGSGSVISAPAQATYLYGEVVTLTATPGTGWSFALWAGAASGVLTQTTVAVYDNSAVMAMFADPSHPIYHVELPVVLRGR